MTALDSPALSFVIPAFNEKDRLPKTLRDLLSFLQGEQLSFEIIISDDGSSDGTWEALASISKDAPVRLVRSRINRGKGHAVQLGMRAARGAIRIMCDADGSMAPAELPKLIEPIQRGETPIAIGSRYLNGGHSEGQPQWRRAWSRLCHAVIQHTLVPEILDTHCGYKAFTASVAEEIFERATIDGWAFDLEVLALAQRLGHRILEVAVIWKDDGRSRVRVVRDLGRVLGEALRIRRNIGSGLYAIPRCTSAQR